MLNSCSSQLDSSNRVAHEVTVVSAANASSDHPVPSGTFGSHTVTVVPSHRETSLNSSWSSVASLVSWKSVQPVSETERLFFRSHQLNRAVQFAASPANGNTIMKSGGYVVYQTDQKNYNEIRKALTLLVGKLITDQSFPKNSTTMISSATSSLLREAIPTVNRALAGMTLDVSIPQDTSEPRPLSFRDPVLPYALNIVDGVVGHVNTSLRNVSLRVQIPEVDPAPNPLSGSSIRNSFQKALHEHNRITSLATLAHLFTIGLQEELQSVKTWDKDVLELVDPSYIQALEAIDSQINSSAAALAVIHDRNFHLHKLLEPLHLDPSDEGSAHEPFAHQCQGKITSDLHLALRLVVLLDSFEAVEEGDLTYHGKKHILKSLLSGEMNCSDLEDALVTHMNKSITSTTTLIAIATQITDHCKNLLLPHQAEPSPSMEQLTHLLSQFSEQFASRADAHTALEAIKRELNKECHYMIQKAEIAVVTTQSLMAQKSKNPTRTFAELLKENERIRAFVTEHFFPVEA